MFRTWLTLPDQSGHHRPELLVSHLTFTLIYYYNCTLTTSLLQAIWSNVSQYQFASLWFALIYYANHYCSLVPRDFARRSPTRRRTCTVLCFLGDPMKFQSCVCAPIALSTAFLGSFISPPQTDAGRSRAWTWRRKTAHSFCATLRFHADHTI